MDSATGGERWLAGDSADIPEGGRLVIDADGTLVGIFRVGGELHAYLNRCPHSGGPVCQGLIVPRIVEVLDERRAIARSAFDESDPHIVCPWHGFEFSIRDGCHAGKRDIRLTRVAVSEEGGVVHVTL